MALRPGKARRIARRRAWLLKGAGIIVAVTICFLLAITVPVTEEIMGTRQAMASVDHVDVEKLKAHPVMQAVARVEPEFHAKLESGEAPTVGDAIRFFTRGGRGRVLPELSGIVRNPDTPNRHRSQALHVLFLLDQDMGRETARECREAGGELGAIAHSIESGALNWGSRSALMASILNEQSIAQ